MKKKIKLLIDFPLQDNELTKWCGVSFPPIFYKYLLKDPRFEVYHMNNCDLKNLDVVLVISAGSQKLFLNKKINQLNIISVLIWLENKSKIIQFFVSIFGYLFGLKKIGYYKKWFIPSLNYEKRLKNILSANKKIKIIHRLDGSYQIICKNYGYDLSVKNINYFADLTVYQSNYCKDVWERGKKTIFGKSITFKPKKTIKIYNGVDREIFRPDGEKILLKGKYNIIHVSASSLPNKGLKTVLEFAEIFKKNSDFHFYLIGDQIRDPICGKDIKYFNNVTYLGFVNDHLKLAKYLRSSDIFLYPSKDDCSSNSIIEAMSSGLPIVTIDSGGNKELIIKNEIIAGIIIDKQNPAYAIKLIIENYNFYRENAIKMVQKHHNIESITSEYANAICKEVEQAS